MSYVYIALLASGERQLREAANRHAMMLREMRMVAHTLSAPIALYTSKETPTCRLPGGGMLIGRAFHRDGRPLEPASIPESTSHSHIRQYLLDHCWGEYVLVEPATGGAPGYRFMRDPSGAVACMYAIYEGRGFVTSDISLAARLGLYRKRIDWKTIQHRLTYPHLKTSRTCLVGVHELLPGYSQCSGVGGSAAEQEWSPWKFVAPEERHDDPNRAAADVREAVMTAVATSAPAGEPTLLELSGGLDSSIIAACLKGTQAHVTCCTLITPVPGADERSYANKMAEYLGVELRSMKLGFESARFAFEPPAQLANPGMAALQYAVNEQMEAASKLYGTRSFLSGGGGDNVFCYLKGAAPAVDAFWERGLAGGLSAIRNLSELHQCTFWKASRLALRKLVHPSKSFYRAETSFLTPQGIAAAPEPHPWLAAPSHAFPGDRERMLSLVATQTFRDHLARGTQRPFHMPLLSQPVMEACLKVPTWMWIAGGCNRAIARTAFSDMLPVEVRQRRSKGTFVGYSGAIYRRKKNEIRDFLLAGQLHANGLLDTDALNRFLKKDLAPRDRSFMRLFELCMVENWARHQV